MITPCFKCKFFDPNIGNCHLRALGIKKECFMQSNGVYATEGYCRLFSEKYKDQNFDMLMELDRIKRNTKLAYDLIVYCNGHYENLQKIIDEYYALYEFNKVIVVTDSLDGAIVSTINDAISGYKYVVKKLLPTETYKLFDLMIMSMFNVDSPYFMFTQTKEMVFDLDKLAKQIELNEDNFIFWQLKSNSIYGLYIKDAIKQLLYQNAELYEKKNLVPILDRIEKENSISLYEKRK